MSNTCTKRTTGSYEIKYERLVPKDGARRASILPYVVVFVAMVVLAFLVTWRTVMSENENLDYFRIDDSLLEKRIGDYERDFGYGETPMSIKRYNETIFVNEAYLVTETQIRVLTVRQCIAPFDVELHAWNSTTMISFETRSDPTQECPWFFAPKCELIGHYVIADVPFAPSLLLEPPAKSLMISRADSDGRVYPVPLHDARVSSVPKKHKLGVCLQPVALYADWTQLVIYMESWISHGATKFYFFLQLISEEVDAIIRLYEHDNKISITRIPWSLFPVDSETTGNSVDPNNMVFRAEVEGEAKQYICKAVTAIDVCILRSRREVEFLALSDFDEIFVPMRNRLLIDLLWNMRSKHPFAGAFLFRGSYVVVKNQTNMAAHPSDLSFDSFNNVLRESRVFNPGSMSKLIVRPGRVYKCHVHTVRQMEDSQYYTYTVPTSDGLLYHVRLLPPGNLRELFEDKELSRYTPLWQNQWLSRVADEMARLNDAPSASLSLANTTWSDHGIEVMKTQEECVDELRLKKYETCNSHNKCFKKVFETVDCKWVFAPQSWIRL